jgi:UDP-N-acetylglucosamine 1-carboxyvinyltransferase
MEAFRITGGKPLHGKVRISGTKNLISKLLVASTLSETESTFTNVPLHLGETQITTDIISSLGAVTRSNDDGTVLVRTAAFSTSQVPDRFALLNRIPILLIGPLLHRTGKAIVPIPGGDKIGARPVNFHINALREMGAHVHLKDHTYHAETDGLKGAVIKLPFPSVGATENIIIAASLAKGITIIENAAVEPEIKELVKYLQKMGAIISIETNRRIIIEGVPSLHGAEHHIMPDRIEAASFACAAVASKGDIFIEDAQQSAMLTFLNTMRRAGGDFDILDGGIRFYYKGKLKSTAIETNVHPGFMTDWQQPWVLMMTQANGLSVVHETVYENRFGYLSELRKMGAQIEQYNSCLGGAECRFTTLANPHSAVIFGPTKLKGANINIPDLRAGFVYLIAAALADGVSTITGIHHVLRGYEHIEEKLRNLGVAIEKIEV